MNKKDINFHGINTKAINYNGVQLILNTLNGGWMLFLLSGGAPYAGTLTEMKRLVDHNEDKKHLLMPASTY